VKVGGVNYDEADQQFAKEIYGTLDRPDVQLSQAADIVPFDGNIQVYPASTDVGDVSWAAPTVGLRTATWVPGTSAHSWQAVAAGGTSIGYKGMLVAAKTITLTAVELMQHPEICEEAKVELKERQGKDFIYQSLLGDREPPLDYRN
jgi:aminobenzoyl-glutamate utilization protein B